VARKKLGKYEIIDRIGRGGMAEVYRGYHAALDRYVAIKLLHPFLADDPEFKDRFENEARNVAKLKHPNIVQVYDFEYDAEGDSFYMVMELINGPTLKDRLFDLASSNERFSTAEAIRIVRSSAEALAYAHQRSMIHRDVKPANLMLDEDQRIVLTDFGIAKIVTGAQFTASGGMVGTPAYMAPEQGLGEAGDERSDIYSLGVILFQLITGHLPFDADTPLAVILKHVNDPLPTLRSYVPETPTDLEEIVRTALAKEPDERYQSAADFAEDLGALDEFGRRRPSYPGVAAVATHTISQPATQTGSPRGALRSASAETPVFSTVELTPPSPPAAPGRAADAAAADRTGGRLRPIRVVGLVASIALLAIVAFLVFGNGDGSSTDVTDPNSGTDSPTPDQVAVAPENETPSDTPAVSPTATTSPPPTTTPRAPTRTAVPTTVPPVPSSPTTATQSPSPSVTPSVTATATLTPTATYTLTPTPTATDTFTPTPTSTDTRTPTVTQTPTQTLTPTPNETGTALADFFATQVAASATPNMTQTLAVCDFEYIVLEPANYNVPPARNDFNNPRLVQFGTDFVINLVFRNTGSCTWPARARLTFNPVLTLDPDQSVNMAPLEAACGDELRPGLNFAMQEQSNFFITDEVGITDSSVPIEFTGHAPPVFGCYYGVWDLLYPNSDVSIGRPLVLAIRVWGGG
jgi:serine/threonine protein kinase